MTDAQVLKLINDLDKWLDIINYWEDEIREVAERYDDMYSMYERYNKMIDQMYNLLQELKKGADKWQN